MRWASRIGIKERLKFADDNRASADSGGRPCLGTLSAIIQESEAVRCSVPDQICQCQRMQRLCGQASDLIIADIHSTGMVWPWGIGSLVDNA